MTQFILLMSTRVILKCRFGDEIQRRELHLWKDETPTPCTFSTVVRLLNCPFRGPGEGVVLKESSDDISGAVLRCYSCACLNMWICPEHKCLLSVDRQTGIHVDSHSRFRGTVLSRL